MTPDPTLAIWSFGGAVVAAGAGVLQWRRARAFEDTPTSKVRSAAQGYVELSGHARALPGAPIISPLSHRQCCWFQYRVQERTASRREGWRTVDEGTSDAIFALDDDTGRVVIDPAGAGVAAVPCTVWYGNDEDVPPPALRSWMSGLGARYRYNERVILDGQPLSAVGLFQTRRAGDDPLSMDAEMADLLHSWKQDPRRMAQFDLNHDGSISAEEWEQARAAARAAILAQHREQAQQPGISMLVRPGDQRPFLFGPGSVRALSQRYRLNAALLSTAALICLFVGSRSI
ncbi:MAG TPA: GIDE domain-containing protein [Steroidobacteraceae bacterium]